METLVKYVIYASFAINIACGIWVAANVITWVKSLGGVKKD